jgi:hypothetical protein
MLVLGLTGLGVPAKRAAAIASKQSIGRKKAI